tara:strand:+ start:3356 stop:4240 length:885 start_codon:yes stop_codon:yes gene_type:complete
MFYRPVFGPEVRVNPEEGGALVRASEESPSDIEAETGDPLITPFMEKALERILAPESILRTAPNSVQTAFLSCMALLDNYKIGTPEQIFEKLNDAVYWFQNIGFPNYSYDVLCDVYANVVREINLDPVLQRQIASHWCSEAAKSSLLENSPRLELSFAEGGDAEGETFVYSGELAVQQLDGLLCDEDIPQAQKDFLIKSRSLDLHFLFSDYPDDPENGANAEDLYFFTAFSDKLESSGFEDSDSEPSKAQLLDLEVEGQLVGRPRLKPFALVSSIAFLTGSVALLKIAYNKING